MLNISFEAGAFEARATSCYGSGSTKTMRLLAAPAPPLHLIFNMERFLKTS
jgi:hypothetical protein